MRGFLAPAELRLPIEYVAFATFGIPHSHSCTGIFRLQQELLALYYRF